MIAALALQFKTAEAAQSAPHLFSEREVGLVLVGVTFLYIAFIVVCDSRAAGRFVISVNLSRFILDGLTFATGTTVALIFIDPNIFSIVAGNYIYATVTALSCMVGPVINLADRSGRKLDK